MNLRESLARLVEEVSGNVVPERDLARLERRAAEQAREAGFSNLEAYVCHLALERSGAHWRRLLEFVTVNESYLFRAPQQFTVLADAILPRLAAARGGQRRLLLWSAGCARGEEAVTLAMVCAESRYLAGWHWEIIATDVDEAALAEAREGRYGARAVAQVPGTLLDRHFERQGACWVVRPHLMSHIRYEHLNLVYEPLPFNEERFDVIFLRNVLIYFRASSQRRVAAAMARVLAEDGVLFLGPSESLWKLSEELTPVDLGGCFVYRHRAAVPAGDRPPAESVAAGSAVQVRPPSATPPAPPTAPLPTAGIPPREPPPGHSAGALVRALAEGRIETASDMSRDLLVEAPDDAVLRALNGLLEDAQGRTEDAVRCYRAALYLEPDLFQVRFLLARALARLGWRARARHEYGETLVTLKEADRRELPDAELLALPSAGQAASLARGALEELAEEDG